MVVIKTSDYIAKEKGLRTKVLEGNILRWTQRGVLFEGAAKVGESSTCFNCGRAITNPVSLLVGYGPICSENLGIPRDFDESEVEAIKARTQHETRIQAWFPRKDAYNEDGSAWSPPEDEPVAPSSGRITVEQSGDLLALSFEYNAEIVAAVKEIPGRRWNPDAKVWTIPKTSGAQVDALMKRYTNTVTNYGEGQPAVTKPAPVQPVSYKRDLSLVGFTRQDDLMPHQIDGIKYMLNAKRTFNGDDMGLGKTVQAIVSLLEAKAYPAVVVSPASLKINWQREFEAWTPGIKVQVIRSGDELRNVDVWVINYDILYDYVSKLRSKNLRGLVFDESHYVKSPGYKGKGRNRKVVTQRSAAAYDLSRGVEYVFNLTGTAIKNRPVELVHQLEVIDQLDYFGGYWNFVKRYANAYKGRWGWDMSGASNLMELNQKLRERCYIRREKKDVLRDLPEKQRAVVVLDITNRGEYKRAERDVARYLSEEAVKDKEFLASIRHHPEEQQRHLIRQRGMNAEMKARSAEHLVKLTKLKELAAQGKLKAAEEWVENFLESGEKLVLFASHRDIVKHFAKTFDAPMIIGGMSERQKQAAKDQFQNDPDTRLIVLNLQAGKEGHTLHAASNVAFVELDWSATDHDQAEDRCNRIGQKNAVTAWYLLAADTIDEPNAQLLDLKQGITNAVNKGEETKTKGTLVQGLLAYLEGKQ